MTLSQYYESLSRRVSPKTEFVREIATVCGVTDATANNWVRGRNIPSKEEWLQYFEKVTGLSREELFGIK